MAISGLIRSYLGMGTSKLSQPSTLEKKKTKKEKEMEKMLNKHWENNIMLIKMKEKINFLSIQILSSFPGKTNSFVFWQNVLISSPLSLSSSYACVSPSFSLFKQRRPFFILFFIAGASTTALTWIYLISVIVCWLILQG